MRKAVGTQDKGGEETRKKCGVRRALASLTHQQLWSQGVP